jgi:hypothetical protein
MVQTQRPEGENMVTVVGVAELCGVHTLYHTAVEAASP